MYRKVVLIFISVFISSYGLIAQALSVLILLIFGIVINLKLKPYQTDALNNIETISLFASNITIYIGIFYIVNNDGEPSASS